MRRVVPITRGGQISIPAQVRHRWGATKVLVQDDGQRLIVCPLPADPIAAAKGCFPLTAGVTIEQIVARRRLEELEAAESKRKRTSPSHK